MTPPVGLTSNPIKPRPIPLKNPSTPFFFAPIKRESEDLYRLKENKLTSCVFLLKSISNEVSGYTLIKNFKRFPLFQYDYTGFIFRELSQVFFQ